MKTQVKVNYTYYYIWVSIVILDQF